MQPAKAKNYLIDIRRQFELIDLGQEYLKNKATLQITLH